MDVYFWKIAISITKFFFYLGVVGIAMYSFWGTRFLSQRDKFPGSVNFFAAIMWLSFVASVGWFIAKTGSFSESGLAGAFDPFMLQLMWDSPVGEVSRTRIISCALALLCLLGWTKGKLSRQAFRGCLFAVFCIAVYSFTLAGHFSTQGWVAKIILCLHVAGMAWWFGALIPLSVDLASPQAGKHMSAFGKQASYVVPAMLGIGLFMATLMIESWHQLVTANYGLVLLGKMATVILLLVVAARHKWWLVPKLKKGDGHKAMQISLIFELIIAGLLLAITAALTSIVSPPG